VVNRIVVPKDDFASDLRYARERSGKSYARQLWETLRLMAGPGLLSPWDYHRYRLWDDAIPWERKREFIGDNSHGWFIHRVSAPEQEPLMRDKVTAGEILRRGGIPVPRLLAVFHPKRELEGTLVLRSADQLAAFLREKVEYPFFYKPVTGNMSAGAGLALSYDRQADAMVRQGDEPLSVADFARSVEEHCSRDSPGAHRRPDQGYLFQGLETNHPAIAEICGPTLATFRIYVIADDRGPRIHCISWKIPGPESPADNFYREGNFYADVDERTGVVRRALRGAGSRLQVFDHNPNNGKTIAGFQIPCFDELCEAVLRGAALFPGSRYAGWDAAVTPRGPIVVEANYGSAFVLGQLSTGRGFLTPEFREYARRAKKLNTSRGFLWPVSWNRDESIWRLSGIAKLAKSLISRGAGAS